MTRVDATLMVAWGTKILLAAGLSDDDADAVIRNLVYAELRGTASHGFVRLPIYLERIAAGGINASHTPTLAWDLGALVTVDADAGPGAATGTFAANLAANRAQQFGIGCVLVRNGNHFGAAAYYAELIADQNMIGIIACNTDKAMCAPGGGRPVLGTNPLAVALPTPAATRPILDMATSEVSYGKVLVAAENGEAIPEGWAVDSTGASTQSPQDGLDGALLPAAGPKGFGLAFMIDSILAVGGARISPFVSALHGDPSRHQELGQMFMAMSSPKGAGDVQTSIRTMVDELRNSRLPESSLVMYPGEPELLRKQNNKGSFDVSGVLRNDLRRVAIEYGVRLPSPLLNDA